VAASPRTSRPPMLVRLHAFMFMVGGQLTPPTGRCPRVPYEKPRTFSIAGLGKK